MRGGELFHRRRWRLSLFGSLGAAVGVTLALGLQSRMSTQGWPVNAEQRGQLVLRQIAPVPDGWEKVSTLNADGELGSAEQPADVTAATSSTVFPALEPDSTPPRPQDLDNAARIRVGTGLFRRFCIVCHGADGTGSLLRAQMPPIPDFTKPAWQQEHTDAKLRVSIMDGKGTLMPANRGRITDVQARDLVAYIRSFGPKGSKGKPVKGPASGTDFDKSFDELELRWNELEKQLKTIEPSKTEK